MADALRKVGEIAVPPDAKLRDWKDAFAEALRVADEARRRAGPDEAVMTGKYTVRSTGLGGITRKDDFVFRFNGRDVGRTYAESTPAGARW
jgi:hypothetical protein